MAVAGGAIPPPELPGTAHLGELSTRPSSPCSAGRSPASVPSTTSATGTSFRSPRHAHRRPPGAAGSPERWAPTGPGAAGWRCGTAAERHCSGSDIGPVGRSRVVVRRPTGAELGRLVYASGAFRPRFSLQVDGRLVGTFTTVHYAESTIADARGEEIARITEWSVLLGTDRYRVEIRRAVPYAVHGLVIAAPFMIDLLFKRRRTARWRSWI